MQALSSNIQQYLNASSLLAYPAAFIAGLLISFTPCVYRVIPIQLGFIGAQTAADGSNRRRASYRGLILTLLFVIGMAAVYAALGAFASLTGTLLGAWAASPWTYVFVGNVLLVMALSMLDVFQLPIYSLSVVSFLLRFQLLTRWSPGRKGNGYISALLIGASSGLIVGSCTAPALGAVLALVGTQGKVVFGSSVLFVFALGMGALMIALGTFGGVLASLPRSGEWMVKVKKVFGYVMILLAEYLLLQAGQRFV